MMPRRKFLHPVSWTLLVAVLLMLGTTTGSAVAHEIEHAHHTAVMHGTGICAWMCAAAGASVTAVVALSHVTLVRDLAPVPADALSVIETPSLLRSRAPPSLR